MYCGHMLLAFAYCLFVVPLVLYSVVGIQDSQGDQPMADGTFLLKMKIYLSIFILTISVSVQGSAGVVKGSVAIIPSCLVLARSRKLADHPWRESGYARRALVSRASPAVLFFFFFSGAVSSPDPTYERVGSGDETTSIGS